jgi:hypothetical protein
MSARTQEETLAQALADLAELRQRLEPKKSGGETMNEAIRAAQQGDATSSKAEERVRMRDRLFGRRDDA